MTVPRVAAWPAPPLAGQVALQGLTMGYGTFYAIETIEGLDLPPISSAEVPRAGTDGTFAGIDTMPKRSLILHLFLHPDMVAGGPAKAILARNVKAAFAETQDLVGLTINDPDLGTLVLLGRPRRCSFAVDRTVGWHVQEGVLAQFDALDPLLYSATLQDLVIAYGTAGTNAGLPFNANVPGPGMSFQPRRIIQNGGFESAAATDGGWLTTAGGDLAAGATLTRDAVLFRSGAASGKLVTNGVSANRGVRQQTLTNLLAATSYTFSVWVNLTTAGGVLRLLARDLTNAVVAQSGVVNTTGSWQQLQVVLLTGAAGPVQVELTVRDEGAIANRTFNVDDVRGDLSSSVQAYAAPLVGVTFGAIGGGGGAAGYQVLVNNGNQNTDPVSTINAPGGATGPLHLERVESGEVITLNYNMQPNDVLELDHDLHTVTLNGNTNRADIVDPSTAWWALRPGNNTIHYRTDGPAAGSYAELQWRDAWL
jgi:hypothetical protein